jgi:hypothetical protein
MFGRTLARFVTTLALLAASIAWMGWIFLRTAADPTRSDRIAHAILDSPPARHEVAVDIADGLATATDKALKSHGAPAVVDGADPALQAAVETALADPRIAANLVDAISAEHEIALGETPAHPAAIDTALLVTAVRAHLLPVEPAVARAIPSVGPKEIKLPAARIPFARQLRTFANRWVRIIALGAVAGVLLAFLIGDRPGVIRRAGFWAIGAGLTWAVVPHLIAFAGDHWVQSQAAVIRAVVQGATGAVTATASALVVAGLAGVAVSYAAPQVLGALRLGARTTGSPAPASVPGGARPARAAVRPDAPITATSGRGAAPRPQPPRTDTWTPHSAAPPDVPVVYDRRGHLPAGLHRRPGVSRAALGLDVPPARTDEAAFTTEPAPTGPMPVVGPAPLPPGPMADPAP